MKNSTEWLPVSALDEFDAKLDASGVASLDATNDFVHDRENPLRVPGLAFLYVRGAVLGLVFQPASMFSMAAALLLPGSIHRDRYNRGLSFKALERI